MKIPDYSRFEKNVTFCTNFISNAKLKINAGLLWQLLETDSRYRIWNNKRFFIKHYDTFNCINTLQPEIERKLKLENKFKSNNIKSLLIILTYTYTLLQLTKLSSRI